MLDWTATEHDRAVLANFDIVLDEDTMASQALAMQERPLAD